MHLKRQDAIDNGQYSKNYNAIYDKINRANPNHQKNERSTVWT